MLTPDALLELVNGQSGVADIADGRLFQVKTDVHKPGHLSSPASVRVVDFPCVCTSTSAYHKAGRIIGNLEMLQVVVVSREIEIHIVLFEQRPPVLLKALVVAV